MDTQRIILLIVFTMSIFLLWDAWQREQHPVVPQTAKTQEHSAPVPGKDQVPAGQTPPLSQAPSAPTAPDLAKLGTGEKVVVKTDLLEAEIDSMGGDLRRLSLLKHRDTLDKNKIFVLFNNDQQHTYIAQSGLIGDQNLPTHKTRYTVTPGTYELKEGTASLEVRLTAPEVSGIKVSKIYTFHRGSYVIDVSYEITNNGSTPIQPYAYYQLLRDGEPPAGDSALVPTFTGVALYTEQEKYHKISFKDLAKDKAKYPQKSDNGWIGMVQHYFVAAWLPPAKTPREFYAKHVGENLYSAGVITPVAAVEPSKTVRVAMPLYGGPEEQDKLAKLAPGLDLTVDYGWLTVISVPLFWILSKFHQWVGNWGVAIIMLTVLIKLIFFPLSAASYRSMAKMRAVTPRLQRIKEQFGNDRQKFHQAMMDIYKTEKINPLGGCLPIVVQIPVFIALYWTLLGSVELRHAPFALWIKDLSSPDPFYVLPLVMGVTMFIQTKLNPTPPDPIQARVMMVMPLAFTVFFFFFPAGLVLYWLVNNILSIAQQWQITRAMERAKPAAHGKQ